MKPSSFYLCLFLPAPMDYFEVFHGLHNILLFAFPHSPSFSFPSHPTYLISSYTQCSKLSGKHCKLLSEVWVIAPVTRFSLIFNWNGRRWCNIIYTNISNPQYFLEEGCYIARRSPNRQRVWLNLDEYGAFDGIKTFEIQTIIFPGSSVSELHQRGLGRSPSRNRFWCILKNNRSIVVKLNSSELKNKIIISVAKCICAVCSASQSGQRRSPSIRTKWSIWGNGLSIRGVPSADFLPSTECWVLRLCSIESEFRAEYLNFVY